VSLGDAAADTLRISILLYIGRSGVLDCLEIIPNINGALCFGMMPYVGDTCGIGDRSVALSPIVSVAVSFALAKLSRL